MRSALIMAPFYRWGNWGKMKLKSAQRTTIWQSLYSSPVSQKSTPKRPWICGISDLDLHLDSTSVWTWSCPPPSTLFSFKGLGVTLPISSILGWLCQHWHKEPRLCCLAQRRCWWMLVSLPKCHRDPLQAWKQGKGWLDLHFRKIYAGNSCLLWLLSWMDGSKERFVKKEFR